MPRELYEIGREIAEEAICIARCAGYEIKSERAVFARSDMLDLAGAITDWLDQHMKAEHT